MDFKQKSSSDPLLTIIPPAEYKDEETSLPTELAYPFCYEPHPIARQASNQVKEEIKELSRTKWTQHNFGLEEHGSIGAIGKMFGVLIVRTKDHQLGYLKAYSGTLHGVTHSQDYGFCPMLYNRFETSSDFDYAKVETELNEMNRHIESLETNPERKRRMQGLEDVKEQTTQTLAKARKEQKVQKTLRQEQRSKMKDQLSEEDYQKFEADLIQKSAAVQRHVKQVKANCQAQVKAAQKSLDELEHEFQHAKQARKNKSSKLQNKLFDQYQFWNINGKTKSLLPIFAKTPLGRPPSGAGDCAAPKLFQYAFQHAYIPVAMAEFWWGKSPLDEIRKHNFYYPACRGKCEPILRHMLEGMAVQENPLETVGMNLTASMELVVLYEDPYMVVVNKPNEMLSVPGRIQHHSVYSVMTERYPNATGPILVHRLDMSTSGILLVAKDKDTHKALQSQFINRTVKKRYTALLEGDLKKAKKGTIELPLGPDYLNRPMQKVDWLEGKPAVTHYEVLESDDEASSQRTRVHFYPVTGRTHQLRVHAAHSKGLDIPIVGDDIYGQRDKRLCLHAGYIELEHPKSGKNLVFTSEAPF